MNFFQAVFSTFRNYANFSRRAPRSELWYWALFLLVLQALAELFELVFAFQFRVPVQCPVQLFLYTAVIVPTFALAARRFHDIGRSGWWACLMPLFPPFSYIFLSAFLLLMACVSTTDLYDVSVHWDGPFWLVPAVACVGAAFLWPFFFRRGEASANRFGADPYWGRKPKSQKRVAIGAVLSVVFSALLIGMMPVALEQFISPQQMRLIALHYTQEKNDVLAQQWYKAAAAHGDAEAAKILAGEGKP